MFPSCSLACGQTMVEVMVTSFQRPYARWVDSVPLTPWQATVDFAPPNTPVAHKASAWNAGDPGAIPGSGRSPGERNGNPLQYSCLENPVEGGAWWAAVHGVTESDTTERLPFHFLSLSPPSWGFSFALGCGVSLVVESNILLSMVVQW